MQGVCIIDNSYSSISQGLKDTIIFFIKLAMESTHTVQHVGHEMNPWTNFRVHPVYPERVPPYIEKTLPILDCIRCCQ